MTLASRPSLPPPVLAALSAGGNVRHYADGEILFEEGAPAEDLYLLLAGELRVYSANASGREVVHNVLAPGELLGEMLLDGGPRSASVKALGEVQCLVVGGKALRPLLRNQPDFAEALVLLLIARLRDATRKVSSIALEGVYARVVELLEDAAVAVEGGRRVPPSLTQQEIGNRVGASREMVNHVLRELVRGGFVRREGRRGMWIASALPKRW